jgi:hypothetical protein
MRVPVRNVAGLGVVQFVRLGDGMARDGERERARRRHEQAKDHSGTFGWGGLVTRSPNDLKRHRLEIDLDRPNARGQAAGGEADATAIDRDASILPLGKH